MRRISLIIGLVAAMSGPALAQSTGDVPVAIAYFGFEEAALTERARASLDGFAHDYRTTGQAAVVVTGHIDRAEEDASLADRRAAVVRDYLVSLGIPASAVTVQAFGELRPAIDTPDGVREPDNRRVEIVAGVGSGW